MNKHLFCISPDVWQALSKEEVAATVSGLQEMGLYHLPYDDELILRINRTPTCYEEIRGLRDHEPFSGKPVRPHLRRGHIRNQRYGHGNQLVKRIRIDP